MNCLSAERDSTWAIPYCSQKRCDLSRACCNCFFHLCSKKFAHGLKWEQKWFEVRRKGTDLKNFWGAGGGDWHFVLLGRLLEALLAAVGRSVRRVYLMSGERLGVYRKCSTVIAASEVVNKEQHWGSYVTDKWKVDTSVSERPYVVKAASIGPTPGVAKVSSGDSKGSASSPRRIRGCISVMATLKFTYFYN
jgi:hypothetical protein